MKYGYLWWISPPQYYQAIGFLGQRIIVIPGSDIVVVITSNEELDMYWYGTPYNYIVEEFIMKAVLA